MTRNWLEGPASERTSSGRYALNPPPPPRVTATSATHPEMEAVAPPIPLMLEPAQEPTSEGDRVTEVSEMPWVVPRIERHVLLRLDGVDAGSVVTLDQDSVTIGRHTSNAIQIHEGGVSRTHARITLKSGRHALEDLGSANGTFVRGNRVKNAVLSDGDVVQLGSHACFRYTKTDAMHERLLLQLFESSTRDALTGAYNRRHFDERLRAELAYAIRHGTELSLAMLDVDLFKKVNDTFGHAAGDVVLKHVARVTLRQLRSEDVFARYGGEEFVVLFRGIPLRDAVRVAERIRTTVEALPARADGHLIGVTLSAGVASLAEREARTAAAILGLADERLYAAKRAGRNCVVSVT
jgi:diguanylate cyclase (GGDEF)-like protein